MVRWRIEHDDEEELGALAADAARRIAVLARDVEHAQPVGKARRHLS